MNSVWGETLACHPELLSELPPSGEAPSGGGGGDTDDDPSQVV